jgi:hypothetical protein
LLAAVHGLSGVGVCSIWLTAIEITETAGRGKGEMAKIAWFCRALVFSTKTGGRVLKHKKLQKFTAKAPRTPRKEQ